MRRPQPFGLSISCAIFQRFSNALVHITRWKLRNLAFIAIINYLDDYLNIAKSEELCNTMLRTFHQVCSDLRIPLAKDKTVWVSLVMVFLGILLDGEHHLLALPIEKINKAVTLLKIFLQKKKATVKDIQSLAGLLNFLHKAIYPGHAFTRRMYAKVATDHLKLHHHVNLDREFRNDCMIWLRFLNSEEIHRFCQPFMDLKGVTDTAEVGFFTDSSTNKDLGFGGVFGSEGWFVRQWERGYIDKCHPSIEYLELFAVCVGIFIWSENLANKRFLVHCDNMAVVGMLNKSSSSCKRCMHLIRLLIL